ncbi:hypothetical protein Tco_1136569 [Tanacetum coccineum]
MPESDHYKSLLNRDTIDLMILKDRFLLLKMSSPVNSLFSNQFHRELMMITLIQKVKFILFEEIACFMITLPPPSPCPPEEFNSKNSIESFPPSHIPVEDSDSLMEEIDIFLDDDDSIPPGI